MIHKATRLLDTAFDRVGIKHRVEDIGSSGSMIEAGFTIDNGGPFCIVRFISRDEDNDVAIRCFKIASVSRFGRAKVYDAINEANREYRYVKFVVDGDGDINAEYDLAVITDDKNVGPICAEAFVRFMEIIQKAYPAIARAAR